MSRCGWDRSRARHWAQPIRDSDQEEKYSGKKIVIFFSRYRLVLCFSQSFGVGTGPHQILSQTILEGEKGGSTDPDVYVGNQIGSRKVIGVSLSESV